MLPAACRLPQSPPCALLPGSYSGYQLARLLPGAEAPHFAPGTPEFPLPGAGTPHFALGRQKKCCRAAAGAGRTEIIFRAGLPENQFPLRALHNAPARRPPGADASCFALGTPKIPLPGAEAPLFAPGASKAALPGAEIPHFALGELQETVGLASGCRRIPVSDHRGRNQAMIKFYQNGPQNARFLCVGTGPSFY